MDIPEDASKKSLKTKTLGIGSNSRIYIEYVPVNSKFYDIYLKEGNNKATKAPNEMSQKEAREYKTPKF